MFTQGSKEFNSNNNTLDDVNHYIDELHRKSRIKNYSKNTVISVDNTIVNNGKVNKFAYNSFMAQVNNCHGPKNLDNIRERLRAKYDKKYNLDD